jgi:hypothetical protein
MAMASGHFNKEMVMHADESGFTLLHCVIYTFATYCCLIINNPHWAPFYSDDDALMKEDRTSYKSPRQPWRELIKEVVTAGSFLYAVNKDRQSILGNIISVCANYYFKPSNCIEVISQILDMWLFDLHEIGVDLAQYGAKEKALHLTGMVNNVAICRCREEMRLELVGLSYGPSVADWHFWFSETTSAFASDFWALVEGPLDVADLELPIPGSWVDDS